MKNIVLICAAGMSTSLLVTKMLKYAREVGFECEIVAYASSDAERAIPNADIVLLGPQVKYILAKFRNKYPTKKIELIDMVMYGMIDGKGVVDFAIKELG